MQRFTAKEDGQQQPIGPERPTRLNQLTNRIVGPMEAHGMDDKIMSGGFKFESIAVQDDLGFGKRVLPKCGKSTHDGHVGKGFLNQLQPIFDLVRSRFVQEQNRVSKRAAAIAGQCRAISQRSCHGRENKVTATAFQTALRLIYPPSCTICGTQVESDFGLCGTCWRETPFISGLCCDACGAPLPGEARDEIEFCDDCLATARPWSRGRAAVLYKDNGRKLVLALKHGDRHDVVKPAASWMMRAAQPLLRNDVLIVPVPLHWSRMLRRRFNQAALLAQAIAGETGLTCCPDALVRSHRTRSLDGLGKDERFTTVSDAISVHPRRKGLVKGRSVILVDDVMTSGATLSVATQACCAAGTEDVCILALARVSKDA